MTKESKILQTWDAECKAIIHSEQASVKAELEEIGETFQKETLENIPQIFGDFLYTALGDRVTGQRSSVLNKTLFEKSAKGKEVRKMAEKNGTSIEEALKADYAQNHNYYSYTPLQAYITVGRKFGVSYLTGNGNRVHTMYFGSGSCYRFLTQAHVDCIKNKLKRELTQKFLDFRDEFSGGISNYVDMLIPTPIDIEVGDVSIIEKVKKNDRNSYSAKKETYFIMDGLIEDKITHTLMNVQEEEVWDKQSELRSSTIKQDRCNSPSFVSMTFLNINDDKQTIKVMGNVDIDMQEVKTSLDNADNPKVSNSINRSVHNSNYYRITDAEPLKDKRMYESTTLSGHIHNMTEVLQTPIVKNRLKEMVTFYNDMSYKLQQLKHNNATLYFLNGDM